MSMSKLKAKKLKIRIEFVKNVLKIIRNNLIYLSSTSYKKIIPNNAKKNIIIFLGADYGNLGDVAITEAQIAFLKKHFPKRNIIEIPISKTFSLFKSVKKNLKKGDIITLIGGGNISDLYEGIEQQRRFIIKKLKDYPIISFPQTIYFTNTKQGEKSKKKTIKVYKTHPRLYICAREIKTYSFLKENFNESNILLIPDIVLSKTFPIPKSKYKREGIVLCIRKDKESAISHNQLKNICSNLKDGKITFIDTQISLNKMSVNIRQSELQKVIAAIAKSQLVITDRLHGMIFCAITNTPCLAIDNSNGKVLGVYNKWLKSNSSVRIVSPYEITKETIEETIKIQKKYRVNKQQFQAIVDVIRG